MIKRNQKFLNFINIFLDAVLIFAAVILSFSIRFRAMAGYIAEPLSSYLVVVALDIPVQLIVFNAFHMYEPHRRKRIHKEIFFMGVATTINFVLLFTALYLLKELDFSRLALVLFYLIKNILLGGKRIALRLLLRFMRKSGFNQKHVLIIGSNVMARSCYKELCSSPQLGYQVDGYISENENWGALPWLGRLRELESIIERTNPDEIFASLEANEHEELDWIIYLCDRNGIRFSLIPFYSQFVSVNTQVDSLNGIPVLNLRKLPLDYVGNAVIKRTLDILGSLFLLLVTAPIMLIVAIGVKLSSPGPVIFRQERVGYGKKPFNMYKFRSMRVNGEEDRGWTTEADPRKTRFGAFIRKFSLDELPQLFNVLKGDMSLVGPRPEVPYYVEQFREDVPLYMIRQQVRPGITGWAQVNGFRGDTSIEDRVRLDRWYIKNWSLGLDISILLRTLFGGFINSERMTPEKKEDPRREPEDQPEQAEV